MQMRLLATGLGAAVLVALVTLFLRPGERGGSPPDMPSSSSEEVSPAEAVVPPAPPAVRLPVGSRSSDSEIARFRGTVEIRGGGPGVPGPRVRLLSSPQDELLAIATVGPDGVFEIETTVPSSRLPLIVRLEVDRPGWVACGPLPGVHLVGTLPFEREGVRLAIAPGMEVRGRVTTVAGEPLHPPVRIVQPSEDSPDAIAGLFLRATPDREGFFRASLPSTERPVVLAQADGYLTVAEQWDTTAQESLEIVLTREGELPHVVGRVVRGDGRTGEAARVTARLLASSPGLLVPWTERAAAQRALYLRMKGEEEGTETQANWRGWYSISLPSPGAWLLEFRGAFGTAERRVEVGGSGSSRCDAVLGQDTFRLAGSVTDRSTGTSVPGARVRLQTGPARFGRHGERIGSGTSVLTDERGEFGFDALLRGVETWGVEVEARGYLECTHDVSFAQPGTEQRLSLTVQRECRVLGRVVCEDGRPLRHVPIRTDPRPLRRTTRGWIVEGRTDAEGRFEVGGLPPGVDLGLTARTRPSAQDPCSEASAPLLVQQSREAVTVVFFRRAGETVDVGDLVLSQVVSAFRGESEEWSPPKVLPAPQLTPR